MAVGVPAARFAARVAAALRADSDRASGVRAAWNAATDAARVSLDFGLDFCGFLVMFRPVLIGAALGGVFIAARRAWGLVMSDSTPVAEERFSPNFRASEFCSRGREFAPGNRERYRDLALRLQRVRDHVGRPIQVLCGERKPDHNADVGGERSSLHLPPEARPGHNRAGVAADFRVIGYTREETLGLYRWIDANAVSLGFGGVEFYPKSNFIHVDTRPNRARWPSDSGRADYPGGLS